MFQLKAKRWLAPGILLLAVVSVAVLPAASWQNPAQAAQQGDISPSGPDLVDEYVVLAWNDLGMHCYNRDFTDLAVLPPFNTLWAQVIRVGDPPEIVTAGVRVEFFLADNTYSAGKSNFWDQSPYRSAQNAFWLFEPLLHWTGPLPADEGLFGVGMAGEMARHSDHFEALGIPLTEFSDSDLTNPYPYQIATVVAYDEGTGVELARTQPVAPVSTEMRCDKCHDDEAAADIATGQIEINILTLHDEENVEKYPSEYSGPLLDRRPVLCAWCHASNALGAPGIGEIPSLSRAMHGKHAEELSPDEQACYNCHPGPQTQCLRDVMSSRHGMVCESCHGTLDEVSQNPDPWRNEPTCDDSQCHGSTYQQDDPLYRLSTEHGGLYCAACHDSPHAIAPSREPNDAIKFVGWQGFNGTLYRCTVCHITWPADPGPHNLNYPPLRSFYLPLVLRNQSQ